MEPPYLTFDPDDVRVLSTPLRLSRVLAGRADHQPRPPVRRRSRCLLPTVQVGVPAFDFLLDLLASIPSCSRSVSQQFAAAVVHGRCCGVSSRSLLFLPNAPYLLTDSSTWRLAAPLYVDAGLISAFRRRRPCPQVGLAARRSPRRQGADRHIVAGRHHQLAGAQRDQHLLGRFPRFRLVDIVAPTASSSSSSGSPTRSAMPSCCGSSILMSTLYRLLPGHWVIGAASSGRSRTTMASLAQPRPDRAHAVVGEGARPATHLLNIRQWSVNTVQKMALYQISDGGTSAMAAIRSSDEVPCRQHSGTRRSSTTHDGLVDPRSRSAPTPGAEHDRG